MSTTLKDKTGKEIELRNASVEDAEALIEYLKKTNSCHSSKMTNLKVIPGLLMRTQDLSEKLISGRIYISTRMRMASRSGRIHMYMQNGMMTFNSDELI